MSHNTQVLQVASAVPGLESSWLLCHFDTCGQKLYALDMNFNKRRLQNLHC